MQFAIGYLVHRTLSPMAEKPIEAIVKHDRSATEVETADWTSLRRARYT
jgi:hypothetical protein